jgi:hypothetical protein
MASRQQPVASTTGKHGDRPRYLEVDPQEIFESDDAYGKVLDALEWSDVDSAKQLDERANSLDAIVEELRRRA